MPSLNPFSFCFLKFWILVWGGAVEYPSCDVQLFKTSLGKVTLILTRHKVLSSCNSVTKKTRNNFKSLCFLIHRITIIITDGRDTYLSICILLDKLKIAQYGRKYMPALGSPFSAVVEAFCLPDPFGSRFPQVLFLQVGRIVNNEKHKSFK